LTPENAPRRLRPNFGAKDVLAHARRADHDRTASFVTGLRGVSSGITLTSRSNTVRVTSKGQVTIPLAIREKLGLLPNTEVEFFIDRDTVRIRKAVHPGKRSRGREIVDHMRGRGSGNMTTDEIMRLLRG
jgi:AbrB family looped-hinge helix DNA binding protein